jgi:hypothetical protein
MEVLSDIPVSFDADALLKSLRIPPDSDRAREINDLVARVRPLARPKAVYDVAFIDHKGTDTVTARGVTLTSRVLRVNLDSVERFFPSVATCGRELHDYAASLDDLLVSFALDTLMVEALRAALDHLHAHLRDRFALGETGRMNPGSLEDWPLSEQQPLFALLGDVHGAIGVELTESSLMVPIKSVSGILFPTEMRFESCQLCPREVCPNRRAKYEPALWDQRYHRGD